MKNYHLAHRQRSKAAILLALLAWFSLVMGIGLGSVAKNEATLTATQSHLSHAIAAADAISIDEPAHCQSSSLHGALCFAACAVAVPVSINIIYTAEALSPAPVVQASNTLLLGAYIPPYRPPIT